MFTSTDVPDKYHWITNRPGIYEVVAGGLEVNWDYYPNWVGDPRVLAVSFPQWPRRSACCATARCSGP
jgi:hypothetical protein